jgi:hypothetical protein
LGNSQINQIVKNSRRVLASPVGGRRKQRPYGRRRAPAFPTR